MLHAIVAETPFRKAMDFPLHFLGGASMALVAFRALDCFESLLGPTTAAGKRLFSFALACTVGVFWEFAELFSDSFLGTDIQKNLHETMSDLVADASGAAAALFVLFVIDLCQRKPAVTPDAHGM